MHIPQYKYLKKILQLFSLAGNSVYQYILVVITDTAVTFDK